MSAGFRFLSDSLRKAFQRGVLDLSASMVLVMGLGFVQNFVLARVLGAEGLGHMAVIYSVMGIAGLVATAGVTSSILRYGAAEPEPPRAWAVYRRGLGIVAVSSLGSAAALALFARSPGWVFDPVAGAWVPLLVAVLPAQAVASCSWHFLQARSRMRDKALLELVSRLCIVAGAVSGALVAGFRGCAIGYLVGNLAGGGISLLRTRRHREPETRDGVSSRELLRFGAWGLFTNALGMVLTTADVLTMSAFVGAAAAVGVYSLASLCQQVVAIPMRAYLDARFPEMTRVAGDAAALHALRRRMRLHLLAITIAPAAALAAVAPWLLPRVFGSDFAGSVAPLWILLLGQIALASGAAQGRSMFAAGWVEGNFWSSLLAALFDVGALLVLVPRFGAIGAATATALTHAVFATSVTLMCRYMEAEAGRGRRFAPGR